MSPEERDALVQANADYATSLAVEIFRTLPASVSRDDIVAAARLGLVSAASRFDPTRGARFKTFAYYRIRGAVFDYIRRECNSDPIMRARVASHAAADDLSEKVAEREPQATDDEGTAAASLSEIVTGAATAFAVAQELVAEAERSQRRESPEAGAAHREEQIRVRRAIEKLPEKEAHMIRVVYFDGETIEDAGKGLGLSKSWASRLHARALTLLREELLALEAGE